MFQYRVHNSMSLDPMLSQLNPATILTPYSFQIHVDTAIIPFYAGCATRLPLRFPAQNFLCISNRMHATYHLVLVLYLTTLRICMERTKHDVTLYSPSPFFAPDTLDLSASARDPASRKFEIRDVNPLKPNGSYMYQLL
jgi:hypothetical protein